MKLLYSCFLALLVISCAAVYPGTIVGLREPVLNQIKQQYYDIIIFGFEFIFINDVSENTLHLTGISPDLDVKGHSSVNIGFDEERNSLVVVVNEPALNVHLNWKDTDASKTGTADITGKISNITMYMTFDTTHVGDSYRPKINFTQVSINHTLEDFTFNYDCPDCSEDLRSRLDNMLKHRLFEQFQSQAKDIVNERISSIVNLKLETLYPETFPLTPDISIDVGLTGPPEVKKDFLAIPIDSTIFLTKSGYYRPMEAPFMNITDSQNPGEMLLFTSDFVFKCITHIMNQHPMHFELSIYNTTVKIDIDGSRVPFILESVEGSMLLHAGGIVSVPAYNSQLEFGINTNLDLNVFRGDETATLYLHPTLVHASFSTIKITLFGFHMDLSAHIIPFLDILMEKILNIVFLPKFTIPKLDALPLTTEAAELEFHANHTEIGVTFRYG